MAAPMNRQGELLQTLAMLAIGTLASSIARDEIGPGSVAIDFRTRARRGLSRVTGAFAPAACLIGVGLR
jgi:hypothetical protein